MKLNIKSFIAGAVFSTILTGSVAFAASATSIDVYFQPLKYFFDGAEKKAPEDQQGFIYQGTTYVPLRFVSEALGKKVGYEGKTSSIYVGQQPSGEKTFLDDLKPLSTKEDGFFMYGDDFKTTTFTTNAGASFIHSLVGHRNDDYSATSTREYLLNGNYSKFEALLAPDKVWSGGLNDNIGYLKIYADDKLIYESGNIASNISSPIKVDVDVKGALKIKIQFSSHWLGLLDAGLIN